MPEKSDRPGNRLMDRPEYRLKQQPLTCLPTTSVFEAVLKMSEKNYLPTRVLDFFWPAPWPALFWFWSVRCAAWRL